MDLANTDAANAAEEATLDFNDRDAIEVAGMTAVALTGFEATLEIATTKVARMGDCSRGTESSGKQHGQDEQNRFHWISPC